MILGSKAGEGGGEPSLEGGKVVSLTRGYGPGCLEWSERRWSEPEISGEQFHAISFRETPEMMMMRGSEADYLTLGQLLLHL